MLLCSLRILPGLSECQTAANLQIFPESMADQLVLTPGALSLFLPAVPGCRPASYMHSCYQQLGLTQVHHTVAGIISEKPELLQCARVVTWLEELASDSLQYSADQGAGDAQKAHTACKIVAHCDCLSAMT